MTEQQRNDLIAAMMFIETAFGSHGSDWQKLPEFAGCDAADLAWMAHGLIQHAYSGYDSPQLAEARKVLDVKEVRYG